jgi:hypothetical protein
MNRRLAPGRLMNRRLAPGRLMNRRLAPSRLMDRLSVSPSGGSRPAAVGMRVIPPPKM